jgi:hypothetical protein
MAQSPAAAAAHQGGSSLQRLRQFQRGEAQCGTRTRARPPTWARPLGQAAPLSASSRLGSESGGLPATPGAIPAATEADRWRRAPEP